MKKEWLMLALVVLLAAGCSSGSRQGSEAEASEELATSSEEVGSAVEVGYVCPMGADCSDEVQAEAGSCGACGMELEEVQLSASAEESVEESADEAGETPVEGEEAVESEEAPAEEVTADEVSN